ncbi:hypothetical protein [Hirschia litorea]|uniref:Uncharacterized protein n=1 Tax=Hirschia litorea TaxID=1199156 RepID=A0ABW2IM25_9PROT
MVDKNLSSEPLDAPVPAKDKTGENIRWLVGKALSGFAFGAFFSGALLVFNIANLRTLIFASTEKWLALALLTFFLGLTFASVQMGIAIMRRAGKDNDDDDKPGRGPKLPDIGAFLNDLLAPPPQPKPIKVRSTHLY